MSKFIGWIEYFKLSYATATIHNLSVPMYESTTEFGLNTAQSRMHSDNWAYQFLSILN